LSGWRDFSRLDSIRIAGKSRHIVLPLQAFLTSCKGVFEPQNQLKGKFQLIAIPMAVRTVGIYFSDSLMFFS